MSVLNLLNNLQFYKSGNRALVHTGMLWAFGRDERYKFQPHCHIKDFVLFALSLHTFSLCLTLIFLLK